MNAGDKVRMSDGLKAQLLRDCVHSHQGPFDEDGDCYGCSIPHVDEFGDCVGVIVGPSDVGGDTVDVRWLPSMLRYCYRPEDLVKA